MWNVWLWLVCALSQIFIESDVSDCSGLEKVSDNVIVCPVVNCTVGRYSHGSRYRVFDHISGATTLWMKPLAVSSSVTRWSLVAFVESRLWRE